jgi:hypothetical protein
MRSGNGGEDITSCTECATSLCSPVLFKFSCIFARIYIGALCCCDAYHSCLLFAVLAKDTRLVDLAESNVDVNVDVTSNNKT